jgi:hypothetical protein
MSIPWADRVKGSGRLSIYIGSSVTGGMWNTVIRDALREFNALTRAKGIGVGLGIEFGQKTTLRSFRISQRSQSLTGLLLFDVKCIFSVFIYMVKATW